MHVLRAALAAADPYRAVVAALTHDAKAVQISGVNPVGRQDLRRGRGQSRRCDVACR